MLCVRKRVTPLRYILATKNWLTELSVSVLLIWEAWFIIHYCEFLICLSHLICDCCSMWRVNINALPYESFMGTVFTGMGLATMAFPSHVIRYSFTKDFLSDLPITSSTSTELTTYPRSLILLVQCFGSQASLCGLLLLTTNFNKRSFKYFGYAMIPYFIFDYYFWQKNALTTFGAVGDGVGNVIFAACSYLGYQQMKRNEEVHTELEDTVLWTMSCLRKPRGTSALYI